MIHAASGWDEAGRSPGAFPPFSSTSSTEGPTMTVTAKQEVQKVLDKLPDDASLEQIQYHLYVLQKIGEGRRAIDEGRVIPHEEVEKRMAK